MGLTTVNLMLYYLGFSEHGNDIKYVGNIFHIFEIMKNPKKTLRVIFRKVSLLSPKKCKTIQRRTLLVQVN